MNRPVSVLAAEHRALAEAARDLLSSGPDWPALVRQGWLDENLSPAALALLAEESGAVLLPQPWLVTAAVAPWHRGSPAALVVSGTATGSARLHGRVRVPWPGPDGVLLVPGSALFAVRCRDADPRFLSTMDPTRPLAEVTLEDTPAERVAGLDLLPGLRRRYRTLAACEALGVARAALRLATEHAKNRIQFGRAIGGFQAVSHRLSDVYAEIETAAALVPRALPALDGESAGEPPLTALLAAASAAAHATETAVQTLGAQGFLADHPIAALYRRAQSFAEPGLHDELAGLVLDENSRH
ncbi:acyl-CoA dehydrogenase family protein [Amycolatopsis albidoflavus]|uniref:Acyl-CoA dehydrogenase family protein n=3 Tax=Amycolatopsis TaxID=1813 RepID=A0ABW5I549_9PSEU